MVALKTFPAYMREISNWDDAMSHIRKNHMTSWLTIDQLVRIACEIPAQVIHELKLGGAEFHRVTTLVQYLAPTATRARAKECLSELFHQSPELAILCQEPFAVAQRKATNRRNRFDSGELSFWDCPEEDVLFLLWDLLEEVPASEQDEFLVWAASDPLPHRGYAIAVKAEPCPGHCIVLGTGQKAMAVGVTIVVAFNEGDKLYVKTAYPFS